MWKRSVKFMLKPFKPCPFAGSEGRICCFLMVFAALRTPDDAWIVHDLVLVWMEEEQAKSLLGSAWTTLDACRGMSFS